MPDTIPAYTSEAGTKGQTMPDTYSAQLRRHNAQRCRFLRDEFDDIHKPSLDRIETAARDFLHALDMARTDLMHADDIKAVDALACDMAGGALNLLSKLVGTQRREIDDAGGDVEAVHIVTEVLEEEHQLWEKRWRARQ